jgi:hypothetical protein
MRSPRHQYLILISWLCLKDKTDRAIATNPSVAAKYLWTTSGIALFISYGN